MPMRLVKSYVVFTFCMLVATLGHASLFEDDEARKAILDLRQRVEKLRSDTDQMQSSSKDDNAGLGRGLLDLQRQIELLRSEQAAMRGVNEKLVKDLTDLQQRYKDDLQSLSERLSKLEPEKITIDGVAFSAGPAEKRDYDAALAVFRNGDFATAQNLFAGFLSRYPTSGYAVTALFWLGNAQYATRDYKEAVINFRALIAKNPEHLRAPEAVLSVANCQLELKDSKGARVTLTNLIKAYPQSEAAVAAKERLASIK
ncbi:tol-pal system protein YbgF [Rhodoferax sp.]|uniref:tol-pal system protein YbgF n=1 Tax=Rhodoferax sp. TaxID=50421 RepID=UPI002852C3D4|nr:tol-pal system protein YbgF [Rhodoferax sp.]